MSSDVSGLVMKMFSTLLVAIFFFFLTLHDLAANSPHDLRPSNDVYVPPSKTCDNSTDLLCTFLALPICVKPMGICNGIIDCENGKDEISCSGHCANSATSCMRNPDRCVPKIWRCDGDRDCGDDDNTDESPQVCLLAKSKKEKIVSETICQPGWYLCNSGQCIQESVTCDGRFDCEDKSDEDKEKCAAACAGDPCSHVCHPTPKGPVCKCHQGYIMEEHDDGWSSCKDVDECRNGGVQKCPQICANTKGSYSCRCREGFVLRRSPNLYSFCQQIVDGTNEDGFKLLFNDTIFTVKIKNPAMINSLGNDTARITDVYSTDRKLAEYSDRVSYAHNDDLTMRNRMHTLPGIRLIRVDYVTGNVYLAASSNVSVCSSDGSKCRTIIRLGGEKMIKDVRVDGKNGLLFVAYFEVVNSYLDGEVTGYTLDGKRQYGYWSFHILGKKDGYSTNHLLETENFDIACNSGERRLYVVYTTSWSNVMLETIDYGHSSGSESSLGEDATDMSALGLTINQENGLLYRYTTNPPGLLEINPTWGAKQLIPIPSLDRKDPVREIQYESHSLNRQLKKSNVCKESSCSDICTIVEGQPKCLESDSIETASTTKPHEKAAEVLGDQDGDVLDDGDMTFEDLREQPTFTMTRGRNSGQATNLGKEVLLFPDDKTAGSGLQRFAPDLMREKTATFENCRKTETAAAAAAASTTTTTTVAAILFFLGAMLLLTSVVIIAACYYWRWTKRSRLEDIELMRSQ